MEKGGKIFCVNGQLSIIKFTRRRHDRTPAYPVNLINKTP